MKNQFTPYYTMPVCYFENRPDTDNNTPYMLNPNDNTLQPITSTTEPQALTLESTEYLNGFLRTMIGRRVRVEFLIGTGTLLDKSGTLMSVGANYITLRQAESDDILVADFYSIKFLTFYY